MQALENLHKLNRNPYSNLNKMQIWKKNKKTFRLSLLIPRLSLWLKNHYYKNFKVETIFHPPKVTDEENWFVMHRPFFPLRGAEENFVF